MDSQTLGLIGGLLGGGVGLLGAMVGTFVSYKHATGPLERAFIIKFAVYISLLILAFVVATLLIPTSHRHLLWLPYGIALSQGLRYGIKTQTQIRQRESGLTASR